MKTSPDVVGTDDPVPSPALANTRRDAIPRVRLVANAASVRPSFEQRLTTAWRRATRRGFAPGQQREDLLETEFGRAAGHGATEDEATRSPE